MTPEQMRVKLDDLRSMGGSLADVLIAAVLITARAVLPIAARFCAVLLALGWFLQQAQASWARAAASGAFVDFIACAVWGIVLAIWGPRARRFLLGGHEHNDTPG